MANDQPEKPSSASTNAGSSALDLSVLGSLSLGPDWSSPSARQDAVAKYQNYEERGGDRRGGGAQGGVRERRPRRSGAPSGAAGGVPEGNRERPRPEATAGRDFPARGAGESRPEGGERREPRAERGERQGRGERPERPAAPFRPTVDVSFYADDAPFKSLGQRIKTSCRTYELFEIAKLILQKEERFIVVVRPFPRVGEDAKLMVSTPDGLPFENEEQALAHVFSSFGDRFYTSEEIEVEPPKGNFQMVHRCGITGEIIGPPNYHRYQQLLQQHHSARLGRMPFEKMLSRLESVREQEVIDAWIEKMKKQTRYTLTQPQEGLPKEFDNFESLRFHLLTHRKMDLVHASELTRFAGRDIVKLSEHSSIRQSVEWTLEQQRRFPLETANHLRGRLRRMNFSVYKKGSKGISYICAVRRRFRRPDERFADSVQGLLDFITAHPDYPAEELAKEYLGIQTVEGVEMSPADRDSLNQLRIDLRWLVTEGYVIEYADGKLFSPQPREDGGADEDLDEPPPVPSSRRAPKRKGKAAPSSATGSGADSTGSGQPVSAETSASEPEMPASEPETPASEPGIEISAAEIETKYP